MKIAWGLKVIGVSFLFMLSCEEIEYFDSKDGKIKKVTFYSNDQDSMLTYYDNGQLRSRTLFKNTQKDGLEFSWYKNGNKKEEIMYKDGKVDFDCQFYENGKPSKHKIYRDSNGGEQLHQWFENGNKEREEHNFNDSLSTHIYMHWFENGQRRDSTCYICIEYKCPKAMMPSLVSVRHGVEKVWYSNGQLRNSAKYTCGVPDLFSEEYWDSLGNRTSSWILDSTKSGEYICRFLNRQLQTKRYYTNGFIDSVVSWYMDGTMQAKKAYKNGIIHGPEIYWHPNGQISSVTIHENGCQDFKNDKRWDEKGVEIKMLDSLYSKRYYVPVNSNEIQHKMLIIYSKYYKGIGGELEIKIIVNHAGRIVEAQLLKSTANSKGLNDAAISLVKEFKYDMMTTKGSCTGTITLILKNNGITVCYSALHLEKDDK